MRRTLLICSVILTVSFLCFVLVQGGNQQTVENSPTLGLVQTLEWNSATEVQGEGSIPAHISSQNTQNAETSQSDRYVVTRVIDGDTLDVLITDKVERVRLIGIDTPETVDPRKPVQCFGIEASNKAKALLTGKEIMLESDKTQGERDKYSRLLRYVFLPDGTNFNLLMIRDGYAHEYTYGVPYRYQTDFKEAQKEAMQNKAGLWGADCETVTTQITPTPLFQDTNSTSNSCTIKGNISVTKEKIYHVIGCQSYGKTVVDESADERWFCSEQDALDAGWRKALNC